MILIKTPQYGQSRFACKCSVCNKLILSKSDGFVLFDMEKSLEDYSEVIFVHKGVCANKAQADKALFSKDLTEFFLP